MWVTNAADAEIFLIFANLDPSKGYKGITCFVAEKEWGVQIAKKEKKVCPRRLHFRFLLFCFYNRIFTRLLLLYSILSFIPDPNF
jgi:hypothetical protein